MTAPERTVRHLRLRAPGEASVRRVMPTLEDALRCASLGDDGARVIVVRRIALGAVAAGVSSQALSRLIETRTTASVRRAVPATDDGADDAACVVFAGALEARVLLALRLMRGAPVDAWYWPLAVREFDAGLSWRLNLVRIGAAIARTPEGRVALPRWAAALVHAVGLARVAACIDEADGERLSSLAGLASDRSTPRPEAVSVTARSRSQDLTRPLDDGQIRAPRSSRMDAGAARQPDQPRWLHRLLDAAGALPVAFADANAGNTGTPAASLTDRNAVDRGRSSADDGLGDDRSASMRNLMTTRSRAGDDRSEDRFEDEHRRGSSSPPGASDERADLSDTAPAREGASSRERRDRGTTSMAQREHPDGRSEDDAADASSLGTWPWSRPTHCGGLLFLLPVLARLGIPQRAADDESAIRLTTAALRLALRRAHAPRADPLWRLVDLGGRGSASVAAVGIGDAAGEAVDASNVGDGDGDSDSDDDHGHGDDRAEATTALADARRWLHRSGRLGLVRLVRRPARVSLTATHVDLHFPLGHCELRVRRLGLDIDPGWLPWFGRVVAFHYGDTEASSP